MNAKYRAKRVREEVEEWHGIGETNGNEKESEDSDSNSDSEEEINDPVDSLLTSLGPRLDSRSKGQLSKRATLFFDKPEFEGIAIDEVEEIAPENNRSEEETNDVSHQNSEHESMRDSSPENDFDEVPLGPLEQDAWDDDDSDDDKRPAKPGNPRHILF